MTVKSWFVSIVVFLFAGICNLHAQWVSSSQVDDTAYFFFNDPSRVERYDMAAEQWLDPITLSNNRTIGAGLVDSDGIYVASGTSVYRYGESGGNEVQVLTRPVAVTAIFSNEGYVAAVSETQRFGVATFSKSDNSLRDTYEGSFNGFNELTYNADLKIFIGGRFSSINSLSFGDDGILGDQSISVGISNNLSNPRLSFFPNNGRWLLNDGGVYMAGANTQRVRVGSYNTTVTDVVFRGNEIPIIATGNEINSFRNNFTVSGSVDTGFLIKRLYTFNERVFAFSSGVVSAESDDPLQIVGYSYEDLGTEEPGLPVDPIGAVFTPNEVFVDSGGIVNLFVLKFGALLRWDPSQQSFIDSINLEGQVFQIEYNQTLNTVFLAQGIVDRSVPNIATVDQIDLDLPVSTQRFFSRQSGATRIMVQLGEYLYVDSGSSRNIYNSQGDETEQNVSGLGDSNDGHFYDVRSRALFFNDFRIRNVNITSAGTIGTQTQSADFSGSGVIPLAVNAFSSRLITSDGNIYRTANMELTTTRLDNEVTDAVNLGLSLKTIREISSLTQLQSWDGSSFRLGIVKQLPGKPYGIYQVNPSQLLAITLDAQDQPSFYLTDGNFDIVAPDTLQMPAGFTVGITSPNSVALRWSDVSGESEYVIERRIEGGGDFSEIARVATSVNSYADNDLVSGNVYEYRVIARNGDLVSTPSDIGKATFLVPDEVTDLAVTGRTVNSIGIDWSAVLGATRYEVQFQLEGRSFFSNLSPQPADGVTSANLSSLTVGDYVIRVRGVNGVGFGPWVELETATLLPPPLTPRSISGGQVFFYSVELRWSSGNSVEQTYIVERSESSNSNFEEVFRGAASNFFDLDVQPLTNYYYRVKAFNDAGTSPTSDALLIRTPQLQAPNPINNTLVVSHRAEGIHILWSSQVLGADAVEITRQVDEGSPEEIIATIALDADPNNSFLDTEVTPGFRYRYSVYALNQAGRSTAVTRTIVAIDGICLVEDDFEGGSQRDFYQLFGGQVVTDGGQGFLSGGVLYFSDAYRREILVDDLDLRLGGIVSLTARLGNSETDGATFWDDPEEGEQVSVQYLDGSNWRTIGSISPVRVERTGPFGQNVIVPNLQRGEWTTYTFNIPSFSRSVRGIRIVQGGFDGPGLDTWAIDNFCILTNRPQSTSPQIDPAMPLVLSANETADPIVMNLSRFVSGVSDLDRAYFSIGEVSNPALFSSFEIGLESGVLNLTFAPQATGSSSLEMIVTNSAGEESRKILSVNAPPLQAPTIVREGLVELNPITGKYEQTLTVANNGNREIAGIQVVVTSLNNGFVLDGYENNIAVSDAPLTPGETVSLVLEYHSETSGVAPRPDFEIEILSPSGEATAPGGGAAALRNLADSGKVFSFDSVIGQRYQIQYSYDMEIWKTSPQVVTAGGNRVNWLDQGPPKTDCHPSECAVRFYRVVPATE